MLSKVLPWLVVAVVGGIAVPAVAGAARPDLKVTGGAVRAQGAALTGSFVVHNAGSRRARRSSAALVLRTADGTQELQRFSVRRLAPDASRTVNVDTAVPGGLPAGASPLRACADSRRAIRERAEDNNCRRVGRIDVPAGPPSTGTSTSSVPSDPVTFTPDTVFTLDSPESRYWVVVPAAYDASNATPISLLVWLHGCGGESRYDISNVSPGGNQSWISIAVGGREGECWDVNQDTTKVLTAIANVKTHFNVDPRRVIIGGYSSGGDLAYRTAFYNANTFAGLLAENTSPFRDTGSSQTDSLAAAAWRFNIVHLAHVGDETYPIAGVRQETDALRDAGFPIMRVERPGTHYDPDTASTGTDHDVRTVLLPHMDDGWLAP